MTSAGEKKVTVTYRKQTAAFNINVTNAKTFTGITLETDDMQKLYGIGEPFDSTGLIVRANYSDGTNSIVNDYTVSAVDTSTISEKTVTVSYKYNGTDYTQCFNIEVLNKTRFTPCLPEEERFLVSDFMSDPWLKETRLHRSVNQDKSTGEEVNPADIDIGAYTVYGFKYPSKITRAVLWMEMRFYYKVEISFNGTDFCEIGSGTSDSQATAYYTYDLNSLLNGQSGKPDFASCGDTVYVRTSAALPVSGTDLYDFAIFADTQNGGAALPVMPMPAGFHRASFKAEEGKDAYLFAADNSYTTSTNDGATVRTLNGNAGAYFTYAFDLGGKASDIELRLKLDWYFKLSVSFDNKTYALLCDAATLYDENNTPPRAQRVFDLKSVLANGDLDFASNNGKVYIKMENSSPRGDKGFGGAFINAVINYKLIDDAALTEVAPVTVHEVKFDVNTAAEAPYLVKDELSEIAQVEDFIPGTTDKKMFDTRTLWQDNRYFVYGFDAGGKLDFAQIVFRSRNSRNIDVSFDGVAWANLVNVIGDSGSASYTLRLDEAAGFAANTGKVYVRMDGFDSAANGWGLQLYDFAFQYMLASEAGYVPVIPAPELPAPTEKTYNLLETVTGNNNAYLLSKDGIAMDDAHFYAESSSAFAVFGFDFGDKLSELLLTIGLSPTNDRPLKVGISFDGHTWADNEYNAEKAGSYSQQLIDVSALGGFAENKNKLYVRMGGGDLIDSVYFGTQFFKLDLKYRTQNGNNDGTDAAPSKAEIAKLVQSTTETSIDLGFTEGGADNGKFIYDDVGTAFYTEAGKYCKYVTVPDGYFVYAIDFGAKLTAADFFIEVYRANQLVQVSLDGENWQTVKDVSDGVWAHVQFTNADITGFENNTGKLFVKLSGRAGSTGDQIGVTQFKVNVTK